MYGISAVLLFISTGVCLTFDDTKGKALEDTYEKSVPDKVMTVTDKVDMTITEPYVAENGVSDKDSKTAYDTKIWDYVYMYIFLMYLVFVHEKLIFLWNLNSHWYILKI